MDDVVELPKFVVTETMILPPPESWNYAAIPGYEVLSSLSGRETRRFVNDFQLLQQVVEVVWPALLRVQDSAPTMVILSDRGTEFDSFVPASLEHQRDFTTSVFVNDHERAGIVVDFVRQVSAQPEGFTGAEEYEFMTANDPYRQFYLQYFRYMIRRSAANPPHWLEEGLVQLLASMDFTQRSVAIGRIDATKDDDFTVRLRQAALLPFGEIFGGRAPDRLSRGVYAMQCYAFVHMCLYGEGGRFLPAFRKLIAQAVREPVTEAVFKDCFGMDYRRMALVMRSYAGFTYYKHPQFRAKKGTKGFDPPTPIGLREATEAEVGRIKGEMYRMAGHRERARLALIAPYVRGNYDAGLLAALGLNERHVGEHARALRFLEAAAKEGVDRPRAWLELGRLRAENARASLLPGEGARFDEGQTRHVLAALLTARGQRPPLPEVYEEIALVWAKSASVPAHDDVRVVYEGALTFPGRQRLLFLAASLATEFGRDADARALVDHGLKYAKPDVKPHFERLDATLRGRGNAPSPP